MGISESKQQSISETFIDLLNKGKEVDIPVYGLSMFPFFLPGDSVRVKKVKTDELKKGDVIVFKGGLRLIAHRLLNDNNEGNYLVCKGDGLIYCDRPVSYDDYCGKVILHFRKGKTLKSPGFSKRLIASVSPFVGVVFFVLGRIWNRFF